MKRPVREIQEETGIESQKNDLIKIPLIYEFHDQWKRDVKEKCFLLQLEAKHDVIIDEKEHSSFEWKSD